MIWLQKYSETGGLGREEKAVLHYAIYENLSYRFISAEEISELEEISTEVDLFVGSVECMKLVFSLLNVNFPSPDYYPESLQKYLGRRIWKGTISELPYYLNGNYSVFIKPYSDWKTFTGKVVSSQSDVSSLPLLQGNLPVWYSDTVKFVSEFRIYVINSEIVAICQYSGEEDAELPRELLIEAISMFTTSTGIKTFSFDWGITDKNKVLFIEFNGAFSIGKYQGISDLDYYRFLKAGWSEMVIQSK